MPDENIYGEFPLLFQDIGHVAGFEYNADAGIAQLLRIDLRALNPVAPGIDPSCVNSGKAKLPSVACRAKQQRSSSTFAVNHADA